MIPNRQEHEQPAAQAKLPAELAADLVSLQKLKALLAELELRLKADEDGSAGDK